MRRSTLSATVMAITALVACGGDEATNEDQIREAVDQWTSAVAQRDGSIGCEVMTDDFASQQAGGSSDCAEAFENDAATNKLVAQLAGVEVSKVTITDNGATAALEDYPIIFTLEEVDGEWKLSGFRG